MFPRPIEIPAVPSELHKITIAKLPEEKESKNIE
jgi:hypothetical protein